jgi:hypothetical protein
MSHTRDATTAVQAYTRRNTDTGCRDWEQPLGVELGTLLLRARLVLGDSLELGGAARATLGDALRDTALAGAKGSLGKA